MPSRRANPAFLGKDDGDRLALDKGMRPPSRRARAPLRSRCAARPSAPSPNFLRVSSSSPAIRLPAQLLILEQRLHFLALLRKRFVFAADLDLFQPAQRTKPHIEDRIGLHIGQREALHQARLRFVFLADDPDHLVEVEIDREIALQHLQPSLDGGEAMTGASDQHLVAMIQPRPQNVSSCITRGVRVASSTFMLSGKRVRARWCGTASASVLPARRRAFSAPARGARFRCFHRVCRRAAAACAPP